MSGPALLRALAGAVLVAPLIASAACGSASLPETEPCVAPTATPQPQNPGSPSNRRYIALTTDGIQRLEELSRTIRGRWPNDQPSNRAEFRQEFATYVRDVTCLAEQLKALEPRGDDLDAFDETFDAAMDETISLAKFGADAVKSRNSSKFRQWIKRVDDMPLRYGEVQSALGEN